MSTRHESRNHVLLQTFEWYTEPPENTSHYASLTQLLPWFCDIGITSLWLPPGCKANNPRGNGYDIYDLWDLGEFEQKGSKSTKWGGRDDLNALIRKAKELGVGVIWDAVLNHKQGGDSTESGIWAVEVDPKDRRYEIRPPKQIEAWLRYDFPGREAEGMKYSGMKWRAHHFNGTDWDQRAQKNAIYKLIDDPSTHPPFEQPRKGWADDVDGEHGNNDYLLFSNIDHSHPEVRQDLFDWGCWMVDDVGVQGFRLDAVQHFSYSFTKQWIHHVRKACQQIGDSESFVVGEIWTGEVSRITKWLDAVQERQAPQVHAYDSPLLYNFSRISEDVRTKSKNADLRTILRGSLLEQRADAAVTIVTNHDTQPGQTCFTPMMAILKPLFYAFILLRNEGYPCVFWGDIFGTNGPHAEGPPCLVLDEQGRKRNVLLDLIYCRKLFAYGAQRDYWFSNSCIGWTRAGDEDDSGCAVLLNIGPKAAVQRMQIGKSGELWQDALRRGHRDVKIDARGWGAFESRSYAVAVYIRKDALEKSKFPVQ
ncbi:glycoside hydrolase superfamily [Neohortaea acidophila]|uniref:Glycoside hydrolase superfamily n=1 Tax=Neohortaea acidophila TaxID=245834 RepID=A0A6A6Q0L2_9PEZI|nr:glycoside hydrolase superfamily [Neohortaea acidophila]KAF2485822.1 glycoside hydrolase superfamily [Neohortaea acidophila]